MSGVEVFSRVQKIIVTPPASLELQESNSQWIDARPNANVSIVNAGPMGPGGPEGPTGPTGPTGPQGPAGTGAVSYRHVQSTPASVWTITHNLGYRPGGIFVEDTAHNQVNGRVQHVDANSLTISFFVSTTPSAMAGEAELS